LHILEKLIEVAMKGVPYGSQNEFGNLYQVCVSVFNLHEIFTPRSSLDGFIIALFLPVATAMVVTVPLAICYIKWGRYIVVTR
jgi:hypothetical protein